MLISWDRMQSIEARSLYKNSFQCVAKIFKEEGLLTFWAGAVPRLGRLILSGGIVFTMYVTPFIIGGMTVDIEAGMKSPWSSWISWILMDGTSEPRLLMLPCDTVLPLTLPDHVHENALI